MIGAQFENVAGGAVDIQDFIKSEDMQGGEDDDTSPNLKLWNGIGFVDYYYYSETVFGENNVWGQDSCMAEDVPVNLANGAFLKTKNNCHIDVAGQVCALGEMNVPLTANNYNFICNPFPVSFDLNGEKVAWTDALIGGSDDDDSPNLKLWNGIGYVDYYFYAETIFGENNVWGQDSCIAEDVVVNPFSGFFLKYTNNPQNVNLTFIK